MVADVVGKRDFWAIVIRHETKVYSQYTHCWQGRPTETPLIPPLEQLFFLDPEAIRALETATEVDSESDYQSETEEGELTYPDAAPIIAPEPVSVVDHFVYDSDFE